MKSITLFAALFLLAGCRPAGPAPGAVFRAGGSVRDITPDLGERYTDLNGNNRWDADEPFDDANGNGVFEPLWLANDRRRPALSIHDNLSVAVVVIDVGGVRIGMVGLDSFGHGRQELEAIRRDPGFRSTGIDLLIMGSSHTHEGPDVVGMYGPSETESGVDTTYLARVRAQTIMALQESVARLKPATMERATMRTGLDTYQVDQRDPVIIDDRLAALRFRETGSGRVIATLVNWASHPEQVINGSSISADYVGAWRRAQQERYPDAAPVFFQGALGGQIGSNRIAFSHEGVTYDACGECSYEKAGALGVILSQLTENALSNATSETPDTIVWRSREVRLPVENAGFQYLFAAGVLDRTLEDAGGAPLDAYRPGEPAFVRTEMAYVRLGGVSLLTVPGELLPELAIGGYDGRFTPGGEAGLWSPDNEGIEDLAGAPGPPYLRDLLDTPVTMIFGVTQDFLGYIIPPFNFQLHPTRPYLDSPDWDHHYEETNALGPQTAGLILQTAAELVGSPEAR
ncbi:MAG: hypothetical protein R2834_15845 [Rhodothermales bacterium]